VSLDDHRSLRRKGQRPSKIYETGSSSPALSGENRFCPTARCTGGIRHRRQRGGTPHGSGLGVYRYVVEQAIALLRWFRRLRIRWEIRDDIHEAFLTLGCAIICLRSLKIHALC
jgi:hypothetical protein